MRSEENFLNFDTMNICVLVCHCLPGHISFNLDDGGCVPPKHSCQITNLFSVKTQKNTFWNKVLVQSLL